MGNQSLNLWLENTWNDQVALRLRVQACLHQQASPFQRIEVYDSSALGRVLTLGGTIVLSEADEAIYSEGLAHPALQTHGAAKRVLILGGGDGGVCRQVCRYPAVERITVVEIDRAVVDAVERFFPQLAASFDDPRVELLIDDGYRFLAQHAGAFDVIIVDAEELHDPSADLVHAASMPRLLRGALAEDGIVIAPLGIASFSGAACRESLATLRQAFGSVAPYQVTTPSVLGQQWIIAWCRDHGAPELSAAVSCRGSFAFWDATLHPALFALPKPVREQLGIA